MRLTGIIWMCPHCFEDFPLYAGTGAHTVKRKFICGSDLRVVMNISNVV